MGFHNGNDSSLSNTSVHLYLSEHACITVMRRQYSDWPLAHDRRD